MKKDRKPLQSDVSQSSLVIPDEPKNNQDRKSVDKYNRERLSSI